MRLLLNTFDAYSHVTQAIPLVQRLVRRGHVVRWLVDRRFRGEVERAGAEHMSTMLTPSHDEIRAMPADAWLALAHREATHQAADLNIALDAGADVLLVDPMIAGVAAAAPGFPETIVGLFGCIPLVAIPRDAAFVLQASLPQMELPIPPSHHDRVACIGPLLPPPVPGMPEAPDIDPTRPLILVTQGTLANDPALMIDLAMEALADLPVQVIATCHERPHPENARCIPWVPFHTTLPKSSCVLSAGGFATMQWCAAAGVPMVTAGETEDKPEVGRRVEWCGLGKDLSGAALTAERIRDAVQTVLLNPRYRAQAWRLATQIALQDSPTIGAQIIESVYARATAASVEVKHAAA